MHRRTVQAGFFALAAFLVYLTLRKTDLAEIGAAFQQARYWWCAPLLLVTVASHLLRAWRWQALLEVLPPARRQPRLMTAFGSVLIGLMVNYLLPRAGEFVRAGNLARRERLPYSGVFGTIVTERVIDLATLAAGSVASVLVLTGAQRVSLQQMLRPALERLASFPAIGLAAGMLAAFALVWWVVTRTWTKNLWTRYAAPAWTSFSAGFVTARSSPRKVMLFLTTVGIWLLYGLMAYIPLEMFSIAGPYSLNLADAMVIMFVGVFGVVVPTPGGVGSFHYITVQALTLFYGVSGSLAATYAVFVHGAQLILYLALGLLAIGLQDTKLGQLHTLVNKPQEQHMADEPGN